MKKVIITGVTGQDGSHMVDYLLANTDIDIIAGVRRLSVKNHENIKHLVNNNRFKLIDLDITDQSNVDRVISDEKPDYFINFAANSFVGVSWDMPENHMNTNCMAVLYQLEAIRKHCPECRYYNAGCYDYKTQVVTKNGIKSIDDVFEGDLVPSLNIKTQKVEYKPIKKLIKYKHKGKMLHFSGRGKDIMVTPNHNMFYEGKGGLLKCRADEFVNKSCVKYPMPKGLSDEHGFNHPYVGKINLEEFIPKKQWNKNIEITEIDSLDLLYLLGLYIGDGSSNIMRKVYKSPPKQSAERDISGRFTGLFTKAKRKVEHFSARASIAIPETDPAFLKVAEVLDRNKINWSLHGQCNITFFSWGLNYFFDQCGHRSNEKEIPNWVFDMPEDHQKRLFEGLMDSDGCLSRNTIEQTSKRLAEQLLILASHVGLRASISERGPRTAVLNDGRTIKGKHTSYTVSFSKNKIGYQKKIKTAYHSSNRQYKELDYDDYVWCLEVEDNHNFMTVRNGKTVFCGNSSEEFGDVVTVPQDETHPLRPRSPYGASKASARHLVKVWRESYNLYAVQGWLFNHEGTRRGEEFLTRKVTKGVANIIKEIREGKEITPLQLGNLDAKRDWSDAEDFVDGIWKMLNQQANSYEDLSEYVLASGETYSIRDFVEAAFGFAGFGAEECRWEGQGLDQKYIHGDQVLVTINPKYYRPAEVSLLLGDPTRAEEELKWVRKTDFYGLVKKMLNKDLS